MSSFNTVKLPAIFPLIRILPNLPSITYEIYFLLFSQILKVYQFSSPLSHVICPYEIFTMTLHLSSLSPILSPTGPNLPFNISLIFLLLPFNFHILAKLHDIDLDNDFLDRTLKAQATKVKSRQMRWCQIKDVFTEK